MERVGRKENVCTKEYVIFGVMGNVHNNGCGYTTIYVCQSSWKYTLQTGEFYFILIIHNHIVFTYIYILVCLLYIVIVCIYIYTYI